MLTNQAPSGGLSGNSVRGAADAMPPPQGLGETGQAASGDGLSAAIGDTVRVASEEVLNGLDMAQQFFGKSLEQASSIAFERAAEIAPQASGTATSLGQSSFSWGGYVQALGILCLLLAALWLVLWLVRRYGRFNFLPRPGALPRGALVMEAQMPLGPRKGLMVVRFMNSRLLLGITEQQICLLKEEEVHDAPQDTDFKGIMDQASRSRADAGGADQPLA